MTRISFVARAAAALGVALLAAAPLDAQRRRPRKREQPESAVAQRPPASWATVQVGDVVGHALEILGDPERVSAAEASDLPTLANWLTRRPFTTAGWREWLEEGQDGLPTGVCWQMDSSSATGLGMIGRSTDLRRRERALKKAHDVLEFAYRDAGTPFEVGLERIAGGADEPLLRFEPSPLPLGELTYGTSTIESVERHFRRHRHATEVEITTERPVMPDLPEGVLLRATGPGDPLGLRELLLPPGTRCEGEWVLEVRATPEGYRVLATVQGEAVSDALVGLDALRIDASWRDLLARVQLQLYPRPERAANQGPQRVPDGAATLTIERDPSVDKRDPEGLRFGFDGATFTSRDDLFLALVRKAADPSWWLRDEEANAFRTVDLRIVVQKPATYGDVALAVDTVLSAGITEIHFPR